MSLSIPEIEILLEAMNLWERQNSSASIGSGLFNAIVGTRQGESRAELEAGLNAHMQEARQKDQANFEVAILIKAKLIQMKREAQSRYSEELAAGRMPDT